ncbi:MAG: hypothetical protein RIC14_00175 [Filomicrobium sp.]
MLKKLDAKTFAELEKDWSAQCDKYSEDFADYATPSVDFAREKAGNPPADSYWICSLVGQAEDHMCLMHANAARLPKTEGKTLRIVWILLAPRYDFEDVSTHDFSQITTSLIMDVMEFAKDHDLEHIKIHLGNVVDKRYFSSVAAALAATKHLKEASIKGAWLHLTP